MNFTDIFTVFRNPCRRIYGYRFQTVYKKQLLIFLVQPENLKVVDVQSFEITVSWDPPSQDYYGISHYLVEFRSKYLIDFVQVSSVPTLKHYKYILTGMEPDVIYKIRVFAEKNKGKGDPTNFVKCRTPKVGEYSEY